MAKVIRFEACPRCRERGQDRRGDNLGVYADESAHCFSCGHHIFPRFQLTFVNKESHIDDSKKDILPRDFTREVPAECWKWLLQYGLSYTYWKTYCGYSPSANRLILTYGNPIQFSQGRGFTVGDSKWKNYGDRYALSEPIGKELAGEVVVVEDLISAHKVGQVTPALPLFGTTVSDIAVKALRAMDRPVVLWLDQDQYQLLPKKIHRLQTLLRHPVRYVSTVKDPKALSLEEIKNELVKDKQVSSS